MISLNTVNTEVSAESAVGVATVSYIPAVLYFMALLWFVSWVDKFIL